MTVAALDALVLRDEAQQQCLDAIAFALQGDPAEFDRDAHAVTLTPGSSPPHSLHVAGRSPSRRIPTDRSSSRRSNPSRSAGRGSSASSASLPDHRPVPVPIAGGQPRQHFELSPGQIGSYPAGPGPLSPASGYAALSTCYGGPGRLDCRQRTNQSQVGSTRMMLSRDLRELESRLVTQFEPVLPTATIRVCIANCRDDLKLIDHDPALPTLLERLTRVRLTALLDERY